MRSYMTSAELWKLYINFVMTDFASFKYRDVIKAFEECVQMLRRTIYVSGVDNEGRIASPFRMRKCVNLS